MRKPILAAVLLFSVTSLWAAAPASTGGANVKTVEKLLEITHADNTAKVLQMQIQNSLAQQVQQLNATPEDKPIIDKYSKEISTTILPELSWAKLKPDMVSAYTQTFTEEEVSAILMFYRTPAGQALVDKTPMMMNRSMEIVQEQIALLMPEVNQLTRDYLEKYQKERNAPQKQEDTPKK